MKTVRVLTPKDIEILQVVNRYRFLTAGQLNRLLWLRNTKDQNRYAQLRISWLTRDEYLLQLQGLPRPRVGRRSEVYALGWRGRKALRAQGDAVEWYYRPSETRVLGENPGFMPHTLAIIDVLIAAERLTQEVPGIQLSAVVMERELKRWRMQTIVPGISGLTQSRTVTVVPDALFSLTVEGVVQHFVLEVDRDTEHQRAWRDKVAALTSWLMSPDTAELLPSRFITVNIVTPDADRRNTLRVWTEEELRRRGFFDRYGSRFMITAASPVTMSPVEFFMEEHWHPPYIGSPDSLIDLPAEVTA
jgi:hypothetical protein